MSQLKVGLLGLGRGGQLLAAALQRSSWCELTAVASTQPQRLRAFADAYPNINVYNDYRALIAGSGLDALFIAIPPFLRPSYLAMAAERQLPVWMLGPPLANFGEAQIAVERFRRAECPVVVYRPWGIEPALHPNSLGLDQLGRFFLADGAVHTWWEGDLDWRGEADRGGGGLLDRGYTLIDLMIQVMGLPSRVYAAGVRDAQGRRQPYATEDVAALVCHFGDAGVATVSVSRASGPEGSLLRFHAPGGTLTIDDQRVTVSDRTGTTVIEEHPREGNPLLPAIEDFLGRLRLGRPYRLSSTLKEHLPTMAVLQAAYLSMKTGQPEAPGAIVDMHRV